MIRGIERNEPAIQERTKGHIGEDAVEDFLEQAFDNLVKIKERTETGDADDKNGIDCVIEVNGHLVAVDITFDTGSRLTDKMNLMRENPCTNFYDREAKKWKFIPRAILVERSMGFWANYMTIANEKRIRLIDEMDEKNKLEQKIHFLETIIRQVNGFSSISAGNPKIIKYLQEMGPIVSIFEEELGRLTGKEKVKERRAA